MADGMFVSLRFSVRQPFIYALANYGLHGRVERSTSSRWGIGQVAVTQRWHFAYHFCYGYRDRALFSNCFRWNCALAFEIFFPVAVPRYS